MFTKADRPSLNKSTVRQTVNENILTQTSQQPDNLTTMKGKEINNRVNIIEQHLNRVCLQQDALMPLLNLLDFIPNFQKNDGGLKSINRRLDQNEQKLIIQQQLFEQMQQEKQTLFLNNQALHQFNELNSKMSYMDLAIVTLQKQYNEQIDQFEDYIEVEKKKIINQFQNENLERDQYINQLEKRINSQDKDLQNIYRELEGLKNENEFKDVKKIQKILKQQIEEQPDLEQDARLLTLSIMEVDWVLQEIHQFDQIMTQRFQLQMKDIQYQSSQHQSDKHQDLTRARIVQMKYQIAACRMKYFKDFEKIQKNQNTITNIYQQRNYTSQYSQLREQVSGLEDQINFVAQRSKENLDYTAQQLTKI